MGMRMLAVPFALALMGFLSMPGCGPHMHHGQAQGHAQHAAADEAAAPQNCPFMPARPASREHYVEHEGRRIYVCCGGCVRRFNEDPEKYAAMLGHERQQKDNPHGGNGAAGQAECGREPHEAPACH